MDDQTLDDVADNQTDEQNTDEPTGEQVVATIELPLDADGGPIHAGDYVFVRGRKDICRVVSMTTDGGNSDAPSGNGLNGWMLHVKSACAQQGFRDMRNYYAREVNVIELTPEQRLLIDFYNDAVKDDTLPHATCKQYAERITVNE
jgi:hypothetical protein